MPTLGQLVEDDRRLIVFTENDGGDPSWYMDGFTFVQDTPLGATKVEQTSCAPNRGGPKSPFLMVNNWADVFPPKRGANADFLTKSFVLDRIRRCSAKRGLPVSPDRHRPLRPGRPDRGGGRGQRRTGEEGLRVAVRAEPPHLLAVGPDRHRGAGLQAEPARGDLLEAADDQRR